MVSDGIELSGGGAAGSLIVAADLGVAGVVDLMVKFRLITGEFKGAGVKTLLAFGIGDSGDGPGWLSGAGMARH